jgi:hypothetical protein
MVVIAACVSRAALGVIGHIGESFPTIAAGHINLLRTDVYTKVLPQAG